MTNVLHQTIGDLLDEVSERLPDKEAMVYADRPVRLTYKQLREEADRVAKALIGLGIRKGESIALWATNVPEWILLQMGSAKMGAVLVTVNTQYRSTELEYLLKQSDSAAIFLVEGVKQTHYVEILSSVLPEFARHPQEQPYAYPALPKLRYRILLADKEVPGLLNWPGFLARGAGVTDEVLKGYQDNTRPEDVINIQYTSGTTGFPKGVMLTHYNIVNNANAVADAMNLQEEDRLCFPVPLFHCFGCVMSSLACVTKGATMVPVEYFEPQAVLKAVEKEACTGLQGVPMMFISELETLKTTPYNIGTLRKGIMAGSPCPVEVMKQVIGTMGMEEVTIAYGQTESSPVITQTRIDDSLERRVTTVGRKLDGVEVKIVDPATGEPVPYGQQGELCARGYSIMAGYYNMPEATSQAIDAEGWLHTGDLAVMDEAGYCNITGRLKDMVIRGGENIYPREIEEFLYRHPKIADVQVVGLPDTKYGEEVCAVIRLREGETATSEEIRDFCRGHISNHKIPRYIDFVQGYPATASGKIQKYRLREIYIEKYNLQEAAAVVTA
ncbi:long-chain-fatty-acid--CoA ligase [Peptococcaceae bacterium CEB3]|nr:long-chain-fatty-acid--CoA ligase [Peptococcaceae bacterium CEB3]